MNRLRAFARAYFPPGFLEVMSGGSESVVSAFFFFFSITILPMYIGKEAQIAK